MFVTYGGLTDMLGPCLRTCCAGKVHSCCAMSLPLSAEQTACTPSTLQAIAEFFTACGEVIAVRLSAAAGQKKAWVEFNTKDAARSAREYDNTVRLPAPAVQRPASLSSPPCLTFCAADHHLISL